MEPGAGGSGRGRLHILQALDIVSPFLHARAHGEKETRFHSATAGRSNNGQLKAVSALPACYARMLRSKRVFPI